MWLTDIRISRESLIDNRDVIGFIPVEQKSGKKAVINNYYVAAVDEKRKEILSLLLSSVVTAFIPAGWTLNSVTLIQIRKLLRNSSLHLWTRVDTLCKNEQMNYGKKNNHRNKKCI